MYCCSALVDTDFVFGIDCDASALERAHNNILEMEMEDRISLIQASVGKQHVSKSTNNRKTNYGGRGGAGGRRKGSSGRGGRGRPSGRSQKSHSSCSSDADDNDDDWIFPLSENCVDTVVTNPPFGTKPDKAGMDVKFLKLACRLARRAVYSFHKSSTRDYVLRTVKALSNVKDAVVVAEMRFDLPRTYKFHSAASVDVEVDLIRVELQSDGNCKQAERRETTNDTSEGGND